MGWKRVPEPSAGTLPFIGSPVVVSWKTTVTGCKPSRSLTDPQFASLRRSPE